MPAGLLADGSRSVPARRSRRPSCSSLRRGEGGISQPLDVRNGQPTVPLRCRAEAEVNGPPVEVEPVSGQRGQHLSERYVPRPESQVSAGFVVVQRTIAVDQVEVPDVVGQQSRILSDTARKE